MPKKTVAFFSTVIILLLALLIFIPKGKANNTLKTSPQKTKPAFDTTKWLPQRKGEKITYDISLAGVTLGKSYFTNMGVVLVGETPLCLMNVETNLGRFIDKEKIFSDPESLLPIKIERDILNWFSREKIVESYDQKTFTVTITKSKGNWQDKIIIKKEDKIHNSILLPYLVRYMSDLKVGTSIIANLPKNHFIIKLIAIETVRVPAGTFEAYHFSSIPSQIDIWITTDSRRIPIKVRGKTASYTMLMREYSMPSAK